MTESGRLLDNMSSRACPEHTLLYPYYHVRVPRDKERA